MTTKAKLMCWHKARNIFQVKDQKTDMNFTLKTEDGRLVELPFSNYKGEDPFGALFIEGTLVEDDDGRYFYPI